MKDALKISKAIEAAASAPPFETAADLRAVLDTLNKADISWHPDDDPMTVEWSLPLTRKQIYILSAIAFRLNTEAERFGIDICEETMESHVRVHGDNSCFYPEHLPKDQREYMGFWGEGYTDDGTVKHEVIGASTFTEDNGYDDWMIIDILNLDVGEQTRCEDGLSGEHFVVRIK